MRDDRRPVVTFVTRILTHYRIAFHQQVHDRLAHKGIAYRLIHGQPDAAEAAKGDLATLGWARQVRNRAVFGQDKLVWQPVLADALRSDLVVLGQENQLLVNYVLHAMPRRFRPKIALFGHGRNFQSRSPDGPAERWKRHWATRCDWWLAYTAQSARHVAALGFPAQRITVFNNAVDTQELRTAAGMVDDRAAQAAASAIGATGRNIAIFVGGLYPDKRLEWLVRAADIVRSRIPDFVLIVVGGGIDQPVLESLARTRPWLVLTGPLFGRDKVALMRAARLFCMPGLLGLAVLDAGAAGLPVVTTDFPWHSPEIAYLEDGVTGVIVKGWEDPHAYADAVCALLRDADRCQRLGHAARQASERYTIDEMARRCAEGLAAALACAKRDGAAWRG